MLPSLHMLLMFLTLTRFCLKSHPLPKKPLRAMTTSSAPVPLWTSETGRAFADLRVALQQPPCLGLPDPTKPFVQTVCDKSGTMSSVLLQKHCNRLRPIAYFSSKLNPVTAGLPHCLCAVAAAEAAVISSRDVVGYSPLTLHMQFLSFFWSKRQLVNGKWTGLI